MGKSMNLNNLTPEEAEKILEVIQKDFELRQKEKERLSAIEEVVSEEDNKTAVLAKQTNFNRHCCIRCCQTFGFIFNRKTTCMVCKLFVCKSCCQYDDSKKAYTCRACLAEGELKLKSCEWFYDHVGTRFKRFGSAKVVRSLYKQASSPRSKYHWSDGDEVYLEENGQFEDIEEERADNESDSGYDPSLYSSFGQSGSSVRVKSRPSLTAVFPQIQINDEDDQELDNGLIPPPLIPPSSPQSINNNNSYKETPNSSFEHIHMSPQSPPTHAPRMLTTPTQTSEGIDNQNEDKKDIYKEAFEKSKRTEEAKFKIRFDNLLLEMQQSFENISPRDNRVPSNYGTSSYGDLLTNYRQRVKDMLVSLSQRLELAVESFDESCAHSPNLTSQKVRQIISKLVEDRLGESLDLTSDEAVSDLSSLSDDSCEQKSYEEQIAQAVLARVLEIHRTQTGVHLNLEDLMENRQSDSSGVEDKMVDKTIDSSVGEDHALIDTVDKGIGTDTADIRLGQNSTHEIGVETDDSGIVSKKAKQTHTKTPEGKKRDSKSRRSQSGDERDNYDSESNRDRSNSKSKRKETSRSAQRKNTYTKDDGEDSYDESEDLDEDEIDDNSENDETFGDENEEIENGDIRPKRSAKLQKASNRRSASKQQRHRDTDSGDQEGDDYVDGESDSEEDYNSENDDEETDEYSDSVVPKSKKSDKHRTPSASDKSKTQKDKRRKSSGHSENETQKERRRKSSETSDYETQRGKRRTKSSGDSESDIAQTKSDRRRKSSDRKSSDRNKSKQYSEDSEEDINAESEEEIVDEKALLQNEFERLRTFARDCNPRPLFEERNFDEEVEPEGIEEEIEAVNVSHEESQEEFESRMFTFDKVNDPENRFLPDFSDLDYEYHDFGIDEVDPDLLSMNLCPILEETEEELEVDKSDVTEYEQDWKGNWIFKGAGGINPYSSINKSKVTGEFGDVNIMVPMPNEDWSPQVGEENVDDVSDLSENEDLNSLDDLSDEEHSFYSKTSEEIARITRKPRSDRSALMSSSANFGVQTEGESDADSIISRPHSSSFSDVGSRTDHSVNSTYVGEKPKIKLSEDLVPSETGDPKFEIPPISTTVPEGEPAKFTCRVSGTQPFDVFWYRVGEEVEELENSENFEIVKEGNRHHLTMYNMTSQDAGQYMCMVMNEKGRCCQYFILGTKKNTQELKAPEFLKSLVDVEVKEGQSVKFRCKVKGYPQPRVVWYKDSQILLNEINYKLERFGNRDYILAIETATMDEDAEYSVLAKNIAGESRSSAQLIVEPKNRPESMSKPKQKSPAKTVEPKQGESLSPNYLDLSYLKKGRAAASSTKDKKDEQNLSNIGKKVSMTRDSVTEVAEDMLTSSKELTEIDQSIAAMDKILEDLETDLGCSDNSDDLDSVNDLDLDPVNDITCLTALDNFVVLQNAAEKVRTVTSMTQNYLDKTDSIVKERRASEDFATSTPRSSESERAFTPDIDASNISCDSSDIAKDTTKIPMESLESSDDSHKSEVQLSINPLAISMDSKNRTPKNTPVSPTQKSDSDSKTKPESFTIDLKTDSNPPSQNDEWFEVSDVQDVSSASAGSAPTSPNSSSDPLVVNLGPKRENKERYSRDFYITNTPQVTRKTPPTSPREEQQRAHTENKIYLSASNVYNLENKVQTLQDKVKAVNALQEQDKMAKLENQVAQTAAKVATSESHVKNIEQSVNQMKKSQPGNEATKVTSSKSKQASSAPQQAVSQPREKPEPTFLKGSTSEQDLPESRTEFNDEYGAIELPSVNRLKAMFGNTGGSSGSSSGKSGSSVRRVHSITARSVPKGQLEKLKETGQESQQKSDNKASSELAHKASSDSAHKASSDPALPGRATALTTGKQIKQMPNGPKQVYQSADFNKSSQKTAQVEQMQHVPSPSIQISSNVKDSKTGNQIKSKQTVQVNLSADNTNKPLNSSQSATPTQKSKQIKSSGATAQTPVQSEGSKQKSKTGNEIDTPDERKSPKIKQGAISAMSKFWEKRLNEGEVQDPAPEILEYN